MFSTLAVIVWMVFSLAIVIRTILDVSSVRAIRIEHLVLHLVRILGFILVNYLIGGTSEGFLQGTLLLSLIIILLSDSVWLGYLFIKVRNWPFSLNRDQALCGTIAIYMILISFVSLNKLAPEFIGLATWLYISGLILGGLSLSILIHQSPLSMVFSPRLSGLMIILSLLSFGGIILLGVESINLGKTEANAPIIWSILQLAFLTLMYLVFFLDFRLQIKQAEEAIKYTQEHAPRYYK